MDTIVILVCKTHLQSSLLPHGISLVQDRVRCMPHHRLRAMKPKGPLWRTWRQARQVISRIRSLQLIPEQPLTFAGLLHEAGQSRRSLAQPHWQAWARNSRKVTSRTPPAADKSEGRVHHGLNFTVECLMSSRRLNSPMKEALQRTRKWMTSSCRLLIRLVKLRDKFQLKSPGILAFLQPAPGAFLQNVGTKRSQVSQPCSTMHIHR